MASNERKSDARDVLECSLCLEPYKMPKSLPCIHTFCLECLEEYARVNEELSGDEMTCPICRQVFKIPAEGFKKLPNNIFIEQIATSLRLFASLASNEVKCEGCKKTDATNYCVDCVEPMCDTCSVTHRNQKVSRAHKVVSLREKEGSQVYMRACPTYCETHKEEQLKLYCNDCSKAICLLCSAVEHRNHLCADIQTSSRKFCDELMSSYPHLDECAEMNATEQKSLDEQKGNLLEQISACERAVHERGEQLKRIVDEQCRQVLSQLEKVKNEQIKTIQERKEEVDHQSLMLSSLRAYVEELIEKGSACAISQSAKDLLARAKQLHADQVEFSKGSLSPDRVSFEPANVADITSGRMALIGWISGNGVRREVENMIQENNEFLDTNVKGILQEEMTSLQVVPQKQQQRITELENEVKKLREAWDLEKQGKAVVGGTPEEEEDDIPMAERKRFSRVEMARVLMERNQYRERLMELQEAIRCTEMLRASKEHPKHVGAGAKKKSSVPKSRRETSNQIARALIGDVSMISSKPEVGAAEERRCVCIVRDLADVNAVSVTITMNVSASTPCRKFVRDAAHQLKHDVKDVTMIYEQMQESNSTQIAVETTEGTIGELCGEAKVNKFFLCSNEGPSLVAGASGACRQQ